jgi:DNA invertase Pin-like site-specific DNA recombinase
VNGSRRTTEEVTSMAEQKLPYDGYVRVSRKNGRSGASFLSPELQRQTIERLAKFHNVEIGEIVEEIDVKGSVPIEKRELGRLVQKVKDG